MTDRESLVDLLTEGGMSPEEALKEVYETDLCSMSEIL